MATLSLDTPPEIEQLQIQRLRQMPSWRKMALLGEMHQMVRALTLSGLRQRHPDEDAAQLKRRLADLLLGPELAARVYGPVERSLPEKN